MKSITEYTQAELAEIGRKTIIARQKDAEKAKTQNATMRALLKAFQDGKIDPKVIGAKK